MEKEFNRYYKHGIYFITLCLIINIIIVNEYSTSS